MNALSQPMEALMFQITQSHIQQARRVAANPSQFASRHDLRFLAWAALKRDRGQEFHWERLRSLAGLHRLHPPFSLQQTLDTASARITDRIRKRAAEIGIAIAGSEGGA
jgi:hypothetical protein